MKFFLFGSLFTFYSLNSFGQMTPIVNPSGCGVQIHMGCPTAKWTSTAFNGYERLFENSLKKFKNTVLTDIQKSCASIETSNEDVHTIIDIKISPSTDTPCIGVYFRKKDHTLEKQDLTDKLAQLLQYDSNIRITARNGYLCAPISFNSILALLRGDYGGPFLMCNESGKTQMADASNSIRPETPTRSIPAAEKPKAGRAVGH